MMLQIIPHAMSDRFNVNGAVEKECPTNYLLAGGGTKVQESEFMGC